MKTAFKKAGDNRKIYIFWAAAAVLAVLLLNLLGYLFGLEQISVFAAAAMIDKYEVRSGLLQEAMDELGVASPERAVEVWMKGLVRRSAALQYGVMTKPQKERYAADLEQTSPNWVTGMSSPWVDGYETLRTEEPVADERIISIKVFTSSSAGDNGTYYARLTVNRVGEFWQISAISMDPGLYPYTGFVLP